MHVPGIALAGVAMYWLPMRSGGHLRAKSGPFLPISENSPRSAAAFVHTGLDFRPIMHHNGEQITTVVHHMKSQARVQKGQTERLTVTLGRGQRSRIAALARTRRTSVATVIRWALDDYIAANGDDRPSGRTRRR